MNRQFEAAWRLHTSLRHLDRPHAVLERKVDRVVDARGKCRRAVPYDLGDGREIRACSPEDLVIHKALAGRG